jgi:hypothetical protein
MTKVYVLINHERPNSDKPVLLVPTKDLVHTEAIEIGRKGTLQIDTINLKRKATEFRVPEIPKKYRTTESAE